MLFLRQSTAVDVGIGPFLDSTDGVTPKTALTIVQADIRLKKNGGNWAQKNASQTLSHEENGWYEVSLDATDTGTLGILMLAVTVATALPVWHDFMVLPAAVYDAIVNGTGTGVRADVQQIASGAITATAIAADAITAAKVADGTIDATTFAAGAINAAAIAADAITAAKVADGTIDAATFASGAINAAAIAADAITAAKIADNAIDRATFAADTGHQSVRSNTAQAGAAGTITLDASASATTDFYVGLMVLLTGGTGAGQVRLITAYNSGTKVATIAPNWATNPASDSTFALLPQSQITGVQGNVTGSVASVTGAVGSVTGNVGGNVVGSVASVTGAVGSVGAAGISSSSFAAGAINAAAIAADAIGASELAADAVAEIVAGVWEEALSGHTTAGSAGKTLSDVLATQVVLTGTAAGGGSSYVTLDGSAPAVDNYYQGMVVLFTSGPGAGQARLITSYNGTTNKRLFVTPNWSTLPVSSSTTYAILPFGRLPASDVMAAVWGEAIANYAFASGTFGQALYRNMLDHFSAQAGSATTLQLDVSASAVDDYYVGQTLVIKTAEGVQARVIIDYAGATTTATVAPAWTGTAPTTNDEYWIVPDVAFNPHEAVHVGIAQAGSSTDITLDTGASATSGLYAEAMVTILAGTGAGQTRQIASYVGATRVATINSASNFVPAPDNTSVFAVLPFAGLAVQSVVGNIGGLGSTAAGQVNAQVDLAIADARLDELLAADSDIDGAQPPTVGSVFHELMSKSTGSFTFDQTTDSLEAIRDKETDIETATTNIQSRLPAALSSGRIIAEAQVVGDKSGYSIGTGGITAGSFAAGAIDNAAIAADAIGASEIAANAIGASELAQDAAQEIADEILDRNLAGGGSGNTRNVRNALRALRNKVAEAAGTATVYQEDDSTSAWTAAVTRTVGANPITTVDPA